MIQSPGMFAGFVARAKSLRIKPKRRKTRLNAHKFFPWGAELEARNLIRSELEATAETLMAEALKGVSLHDDNSDLNGIGSDVPLSFSASAEKIASDIEKFQTQAFSNFSELTIGTRYIPPVTSGSQSIKSAWKQNFLTLCKSANEEMKKKISISISNAVMRGNGLKETEIEIRKINSDFSKGKSDLIARTETAKLNSAIARAQSLSVGIDYYEWGAAMDERTRPSHSAMNGLICKWDDPDGYYTYENGEMVHHDRTTLMFHGAPGEDYNCRCTALPWIPELADSYSV